MTQHQVAPAINEDTARKITEFGGDAIATLCAKYDKDGNGKFEIGEVRSIVNDLRNEKTAKKAYKGAAIGFFLILVLAMGAIFGVSLAAGQALKDSKIESAPPAEGEEGGVAKAVMETVDGVAVAVSVAEGESDIFDIVAMDMNELKDLKSVSVFVDMTADASIGDWVPYVATLAAAYKKGNEVAFLKTTAGDLLTIDSENDVATLKVADGTVFPASAQVPESRRRLALTTCGARTYEKTGLMINEPCPCCKDKIAKCKNLCKPSSEYSKQERPRKPCLDLCAKCPWFTEQTGLYRIPDQPGRAAPKSKKNGKYQINPAAAGGSIEYNELKLLFDSIDYDKDGKKDGKIAKGEWMNRVILAEPPKNMIKVPVQGRPPKMIPNKIMINKYFGFWNIKAFDWIRMEKPFIQFEDFLETATVYENWVEDGCDAGS